MPNAYSRKLWPSALRSLQARKLSGYGKPIPIHVTITVRGDELVVDYTGTSEQVKGAINATPSFAEIHGLSERSFGDGDGGAEQCRLFPADNGGDTTRQHCEPQFARGLCGPWIDRLSDRRTARSVARSCRAPVPLHDAEARELPSKFTTTIHSGDLLHHVQPGGGGHGDPLERAPLRVLEDVLDEKLSPEFARREYGVVIHLPDGTVDVEETDRLRCELRAARR